MDTNQKLESLRVHYRMANLDISDCDAKPEKQFDKWLNDAITSHCDEPNAFVLSTVNNGRPRGRVVLLKGIHDGKFIFYTNYQSAKGHEIDSNPHVALTFLWLPLQRQVRIEGTIQKADLSLSDEYFKKRPRGNQLGAMASPQSKKISSREALEALFKTTDEKYHGVNELTRPAHWGGYSVSPEYFEFWQGRDNRMHDRIIYEKIANNWELNRLAP